jgi:plastocyanin
MMLWTAGVLSLVACGRNEGEDETASREAPPAAGQTPGGEAAAPAGGGAISGVVSFEGTPPANPAIDMSEEPECAAKHPGGATDPVVVVRDGKLANVFVYVKSGLPDGQEYPVPATPVMIDQEGCLYTPRVLGVMTGQKLAIRNSDPVLHNIKAVPKINRGFNISQPKEGMETTRTFSKEEVMVPFECNVHSWMHARAGVLPHPFHATSGPDGSFTIRGLPPGTYEVEALHEKLGTRTMKVEVPATGAATANFSFAGTTS